MYSKFGKVLAERFQILNHRDEILSGKVKKMKPPPVFTRNTPKPQSVDITDESSIVESVKELPMQINPSQTAKKTCSFLSQSREDFYKATDKKITSPPCGHYNCKYSLVYSSIRVPKFKGRPPTRSRRKTVQSFSDFESPPEKPRKKVKTPISFDKQISRPSITSYSNDVNEERFVKFDDMPENYSKYKRVSTPNLCKGTERNKLFPSHEHSPDYNPSFKLVTNDIGKVTKFEKYSARKEGKVDFQNDVRVYKPNYSFVEKKICGPDFAKISSRPTSASPLPCFMKNANWRTAIGLMNEKSLEMNYYIDKESVYNTILA